MKHSKDFCQIGFVIGVTNEILFNFFDLLLLSFILNLMSAIVTPEFVLLTHLVGDQTADALKTHNLQIDIILISTVEIVPKQLQIMSGLTLICFQYYSMPFRS